MVAGVRESESCGVCPRLAAQTLLEQAKREGKAGGPAFKVLALLEQVEHLVTGNDIDPALAAQVRRLLAPRKEKKVLAAA